MGSRVREAAKRRLGTEPSDLPITSTVVQLLLVEPLPIYAFYVSFLDLLTQVVAFLELWYYGRMDVQKGLVIGEYVNCVYEDVFNSCWSLDLNFKGKCLEEDGMNLMGFVNVGCLVFCLLAAVCPLIALLLKGEVDVCSGRFLASKWDFERSSFYRVLAAFLVVYTVISIVLGALTTSVTLDSRLGKKLLEAFVYNQLAAVLLLITSAFALTRSYEPQFSYKSARFRNLRFRRSWSNVLFESNSAFAMRLENAVLTASAGRPDNLEAMVLPPWTAAQVTEICVPADPEEADSDESSGSGE